jgi:PAS domain S-box-containing protein
MSARSIHRRAFLAYGTILLAIAGITLLRVPLQPVFHGRAPYELYYLPILYAAWHWGFRATLFAIVVSLGAAWTFVVPRGEPGYAASVVIFFVVSGAILVMARSARKREESLAAWAAVVESSDDAIVTKNLDGIILSWNQGAERLFGYTADEIVGRPVTTIIPPELRAQEREILERLRSGERIEHVETVRLTKGGRSIDVSLTISPVRGPSGEIIGASKIARDISDRKRAAQEIAAEREWFDRTLRSIGDAVIATDANGRVELLNPVAERLTEWRNEDARGRDCDEIFRVLGEKTRKPVESPIARVRRLGTVVGLANGTVLLGKNGTERPIDDSAAPILGSDGQLRGVVLVFRDVSDRRRAEAQLRAVAIERDRLLERERAARAEAEHANRSKDEFVAMVSHELRTPLNAIIGWTQILRNAPDDVERVGRGLEVIERNARAQGQLVGDLLDMSRIISGKLRLEVRDLDLIAVIRSAIETTKPAAEAKGISLDTTFDASVAATTGDPNRLQQCIWNLLSNAIKFTPQGGRVGIALKRSDSHVEIRVSDSGIGIRSDFLPFVFERFRQDDTSTTRKSGGLGLGLSIVKQLAELHGGHVRVESDGEGQGATFTIALPIGALRVSGTSVQEAAQSSLGRLRVLLVEDDADNREVLRTLLEQHDAVVTAAASAKEALESLKVVKPSVLVSDIGLPEMDGFELIRRVRRFPPSAGGRIPAIALTAHATSEDRTTALRAGFQAHITKPCDPRELVACIVSLTGLTANEAQSPPSASAPASAGSSSEASMPASRGGAGGLTSGLSHAPASPAQTRR